MSVSIDQAGHDDHVTTIDHFRAERRQMRSQADDARTSDVQVTGWDVAHRGIHRDQVGAANDEAALRR